MIDSVRIESDEDGFHLILEGDLVEECRRYLDDPNLDALDLLLPQTAAIELLTAVEPVREWHAEGEAVRREVAAYVAPDDDERDPAEDARERADLERKRRRENR